MNRVAAGGVFAALAWGCSDSSTEPEGLVFEAVSETSLTAIVGTSVTSAPAVRVTRSGSPELDVAITFIPSGGGSVVTRNTRTDADGIATSGTWTLGTSAQPQWVTAYSAGVARVVFTALGTPTSERLITPYLGSEQTANTGTELPLLLKARLSDTYGNGIASQPVVFTVTSGNGSIASEPALTDAQGIATSRPWTLGDVAGLQHARARFDTLFAVFVATACDAVCQGMQLFFWREGDFYRRDFGGTTRRLTRAGWHSEPALSRDGRRIASVRFFDESPPQLFIMNSDGSGLRQRSTDYTSPAWSPDGTLLAVERGFCDSSCAIDYIGADDQFTPEFIIDRAESPAWAPDGRGLAFVSVNPGSPRHAVHFLDFDGGQVSVVSPRGDYQVGNLTWSPDGSRIAYSRCVAGRCDIFSAAVNGSDIRQLTTTGNAHVPAWSPDGTKIAVGLIGTGGHQFSSATGWIDAQNGGTPIQVVANAWYPQWWPRTQATVAKGRD